MCIESLEIEFVLRWSDGQIPLNEKATIKPAISAQ
jgi:hypothetical protein